MCAEQVNKSLSSPREDNEAMGDMLFTLHMCTDASPEAKHTATDKDQQIETL